jgi:hypothetical protein
MNGDQREVDERSEERTLQMIGGLEIPTDSVECKSHNLRWLNGVTCLHAKKSKYDRPFAWRLGPWYCTFVVGTCQLGFALAIGLAIRLEEPFRKHFNGLVDGEIGTIEFTFNLP